MINWLIILEILYLIAVGLICIRIIFDTRNNTKALAYILLIVFLPVIGIIFYFSFGINYRRRKIYSKKLIRDVSLAAKLSEKIFHDSKMIFDRSPATMQVSKKLALMLLRDSDSPLTENNAVKLLINGENKFPEVIQALKQAKRHIHLEYYIFDDDRIGQEIEKVLIEKVKEGVTVRVIYDDFGSRPIRRKMVSRLKEGGVKVFPFHKIAFIALANRLNYRNHRKIIVIDGRTGFIGGINISDKYINKENSGKLFWRDTHLKIEGTGVRHLQYLFLCDWNFCAKDDLQPDESFFPAKETFKIKGDKLVQIAASGPDSEIPTILFALLHAMNLASEEILLTTPYFIPEESIQNALTIAALGGVSVKLLVPERSDSFFVDAAASSYYEDLLKAGVAIYRYKKGFVHAKTLVIDRKIAMVGTANIDYRSFDLNFEVNAIIYDEGLAAELRKVFYEDMANAESIDITAWQKRPRMRQLFEKAAGLLSPLL